MKHVGFLFAFVALLTLPAVAVAQSLSHTSADQAPISTYQAATTGVSIVDFAFQPGYVVVPAGGTVSWYNAGAAPHTVTSDWGAFDSGTLGSGGVFSMTFWTPGTYTYHCAIHPGMVGTVDVTGM
jgi:plastocyanin